MTGRHAIRTLLFLFLTASLHGCDSERIRMKEAQLRELEQQVAEQKAEIEQLRLTQQKTDEKRQACNEAFNAFERAQALAVGDSQEAIRLYRDGLSLCPDDDVARYELGRLLARTGRSEEARREFTEALRVNPNFEAAKRELQSLPTEPKAP